MINLHPDTCSGCPLHDDKIGFGFTEVEGSGEIPLLLVGEASGENEMRENLPFRPSAEAGSVLTRALNSVGLMRKTDEIFRASITNIIRCQPAHNQLLGMPYELPAIQHCSQYLNQVISERKPLAIAALGQIAFRSLTGLMGKKKTSTSLRGYPIPALNYSLNPITPTSIGGLPIPVIGTFHPSYLRRGAPELFPILCNDLWIALQIAKKKRPVHFTPESAGVKYEIAGPQELAALHKWLLQHPEAALAFDIETPHTSGQSEEDYDKLVKDGAGIISIQFSIRPGEGMFVNWNDENLPWIKKLLETTPNFKINQNIWIFERRKLAQNGVVINGPTDDIMEMFHHLQPDLPRDLQTIASFYHFPFPWKYQSETEPVIYGCADVDSVQWIYEPLMQDLKFMGLLDGYETYVKGLRPVLDRMSDRGIYLDPVKKEEFRANIAQELSALTVEIQDLCPGPVKNRKEYRKQWPKDPQLKAIVSEYALTISNGAKPKPVKIPDLPNAWRGRITDELNYNWEPDCLFVEKPFLPNSHLQVKAYMRHMKIPVSIGLDGKETTEKDDMDKLVRRLKKSVRRADLEAAVFLPKIITWRELDKMESTYIDGWKVDENNRTHTTFGFGTGTGQLTSTEPNVQNAPKHGVLGKLWRECISASPDCTLMEGDWKSFHALMLGFLAEDPDYMRLARLDCHSFLAAHLIKPQLAIILPMLRDAANETLTKNRGKLSDEEIRDLTDRIAFYSNHKFVEEFLSSLPKWLTFPDDELLTHLKVIKRYFKFWRDKKAKPTILGYGFGLGADKLYKMNDESFSGPAEAKKIILLLNSLFPRTARFRETIKIKAHQQGYLKSPWGFIRRFYDAKRWSSKAQDMTAGDQAEAAIAFLPANYAFGKVREAMIAIMEAGWDEKYRLVNTVHDSLVFDCPNEFLEEACVNIKRVMELPASKIIHPDLAPNGLSCEAEISIGPNWANLKEVKFDANPS